MSRKNRVCATCGEQYSYCPNCNRKAPYWMAEFHTENCKNIYQICTQYNVGLLTKEGAQEALNACDLSNKEKFSKFIKGDFANIFEPEKSIEVVEEHNDVVAEQPVVERKKHKSHEVVETTENE